MGGRQRQRFLDDRQIEIQHWDGTRWSFDAQIPSRSRPLTEHWVGVAWRIVPAPGTGRFHADQLTGVTAISPNHVWSLGNYVDDAEKTLTERWNGVALTIKPAPFSFSMNDVAAAAPDDVWAVGWMISSSNIEDWNGTRWSVVPSP